MPVARCPVCQCLPVCLPVCREQLSSAKTVYKLSEEKFDLLQPGNLPAFKPSSGAAETTSKALAELRSVVDNHLKVRTPCALRSRCIRTYTMLLCSANRCLCNIAS